MATYVHVKLSPVKITVEGYANYNILEVIIGDLEWKKLKIRESTQEISIEDFIQILPLDDYQKVPKTIYASTFYTGELLKLEALI